MNLRPNTSLRSLTAGFALLELCFAIAVFSSFAVASILGLMQFNRFASVARYETLATAAARQRLDQIMTISWTVLGAVPSVLTIGTATETNLVLNSDSFNAAAGLSSAFTAADTAVPITARTTTISAVSGNTRLLRAMVTVAYTYRGRPYSCSLTALRTTDDF